MELLNTAIWASIEMGCFFRFPRTSRRNKSLRKYSNLDLNPKYFIQFSMSFHQKKVVKRKI